MSDRITRGKEAEDAAMQFLLEKGYEIIARNYRHKRSEIDLIARLNNWLVFVEVRMRTSSAFGYPEETIGSAKRKKVMEGAAHYLEQTGWEGNVRYDIIAILHNEVKHFEDAFY